MSLALGAPSDGAAVALRQVREGVDLAYLSGGDSAPSATYGPQGQNDLPRQEKATSPLPRRP